MNLAAYGYGRCRNDGFVDGDKRTAWVVSRPFLRLNGGIFFRRPEDVVALMQSLDAGRADEATFAIRLRSGPA